jgi:hypothetical protein
LSPDLQGKVKLTASSTTSHRSSSTKIRIAKQYGDNGREHGDNGRGHGDNGRGHGENAGGHGDIARVLGIGVTGAPNSIARVLERG